MSVKFEVADSRRLTGKGLLWELPGGVMDIHYSGVSAESVIDCWQKHARDLLDALGWQQEQTVNRCYDGGVSLALSAPMDALYAACEINEAAWASAEAELQGAELPDRDQQISYLRGLIDEELNPCLMAILEEAKARNCPCLVDDDELSLGYGETAKTWPVTELPSLDGIQWQKYAPIPVALVTGTNGKSTTVRLTSSIMAKANLRCGLTSTDFIKVGDEIIDHGDYSGPGGARTLLRDNRCQVALLEVARGGLLRRGLPIDHANAALITNIAADHLGEYGINDLTSLTEAKFIVAKALESGDTLVLNADDENLVRHATDHADQLRAPIVWFSLDPNNQQVSNQLVVNAPCCYCEGDELVYHNGEQPEVICTVGAVPMTMNGAAAHNVSNALGVIALCKALGIDNQSIAEGLKTFASSYQDNPGRGNILSYGGADVMMDFAHNPHSMKAIVSTANHLANGTRWLLTGQAGDRSDSDITDMLNEALQFQPDHIVICELPGYLRGREEGEVSEIMRQHLQAMGCNAQLHFADSPPEGAGIVRDNLKAGDFALIFALTQRPEVMAQFENQ